MLFTIVNKFNLVLTIISYYFINVRGADDLFDIGPLFEYITYNTLLYNILYSITDIYSKDMYIFVSLILYIDKLKDTCIGNKFKNYFKSFIKKFKCEF